MTNYRVESSSGRAARKMRLGLMGPAFIAAIGYIDPGLRPIFRRVLASAISYCGLSFGPT